MKAPARATSGVRQARPRSRLRARAPGPTAERACPANPSAPPSSAAAEALSMFVRSADGGTPTPQTPPTGSCLSASTVDHVDRCRHAGVPPLAQIQPFSIHPGPPKRSPRACWLCGPKQGRHFWRFRRIPCQTSRSCIKQTAPRTATGSGAPKHVPAGHAWIAPAAAPPLSLQTQSHSHPGTWPLCRMPTPLPLTPHTSLLFPPSRMRRGGRHPTKRAWGHPCHYSTFVLADAQ